MAYTLSPISPGLVDIFWPDIWTFVANACLRSNGRYKPHHVREFAESGIWQLWTVTNEGRVVFVFATEILVYPTGLKTIAFKFGTGEGRENWIHLLDDVLAHARHQGCTLGEGAFRKGWRRVLKDWSHTHEFLERKL